MSGVRRDNPLAFRAFVEHMQPESGPPVDITYCEHMADDGDDEWLAFLAGYHAATQRFSGKEDV